MKKVALKLWHMNCYTVAQMRSWTKEAPTSKRYSYDEFYEAIGIAVEEYDANVDTYKDMHYEDIKTYLATQKEA